MTVHTTIVPEKPGRGRLGAHMEWDEASEAFMLAPAEAKPRSVKPWTRRSPIWNQEDTGACVGNGTLGTVACDSKDRTGTAGLTEADALEVYGAATRLDNIAGHYPPDDTGSTATAGMKALHKDGRIVSYHWGRSVSGLVNALQVGPVAVATLWKTGMDNPQGDGLIRYVGRTRGAHCYLVRWVNLDQGVAGGDNSWGEDWGKGGSFEMPLADWQKAFAEGGTLVQPRFA